MADTFYIKQNDTRPAIRYALEPATISLIGASVRFRMRSRAGVSLVDMPALIVTATGTPTVEYQWQAGDTVAAGVYEAEFQVTYADGNVETFPNVGFINVRMEPDIAALVPSSPPLAFTIGQWELSNVPSAAGNTLGISFTALPAGTTAVRVSINGGASALLTPAPATGAQYMITVPATTLASVQIFASNAAGDSAASDTKTATPTIAVPLPFTAGQWTLTDSPNATGDRLAIRLSAIPATATAVRYSINGGAVTLLTASPAINTDYQITVLAGAVASIRIFASNAGGSSTASDTKTATPTVAVPAAFTSGQWALADIPSTLGNTLGITLSAIPATATSVRVSINGEASTLLTAAPATGQQYPITVPVTSAANVRIFAANAGGSSAASDTKTETPTIASTSPLPTTMQTSVTYRGRTMNFSAAVPVGFDVTGRPIIISDGGVTITGFDLPSDNTDGGNWRHGTMKNPAAAALDSPQGFDQRASLIPANGTGRVPFLASANIDPGYTGTSIVIAAGERAVITKATQRNGMAGVNAYRQIGSYAHFTFLPAADCVADMFAPPPSRPDHPIYRMANINYGVLRNLTPPAGFPTASQILAMDPEDWAYFGFGGTSGENLRRIQTAFAIDPTESYSANLGRALSAILYAAHCTSGPDREAIVKHIVRRGIDLHGAAISTPWGAGSAGAGMHHVYSPFRHFTAFLLADADMLASAQAQLSNTFTHPFLVPPSEEGRFVSFPANSGQSWQNRATFSSEDIGKPWWRDTWRGSNVNTRYIQISLPAGAMEAFPVLLLRDGPGNVSGVEAVLQGPNNSTNTRSAILQVYDRVRDWFNLDVEFFMSSPVSINYNTLIGEWRSELPEYGWSGTPDLMEDGGASANSFVAAITDGFSWNLGASPWTAATGNSAILEWQVQYSLDGVQWRDVDTQGVAGSQTGLIRGRKYFARFRRRNVAGWSKWSFHHPLGNSGAATPGVGFPNAERNAVIPGGTGTLAAPVQRVAPAVFKPRYPRWLGLEFVPASPLVPGDVYVTCGNGDWSGFPAPTFTYQWQLDGVDVPGAQLKDYYWNGSDAGKVLTCNGVATNSSGSVPFTTAGVTLPATFGNKAFYLPIGPDNGFPIKVATRWAGTPVATLTKQTVAGIPVLNLPSNPSQLANRFWALTDVLPFGSLASVPEGEMYQEFISVLAGADGRSAVVLRATGDETTATGYVCQAIWGTSSVGMGVVRTVNGVRAGQAGTVNVNYSAMPAGGLTLNADRAAMRVRWRMVGANLEISMKCWSLRPPVVAEGDNEVIDLEPVNWQTTWTDTSPLPTGECGFGQIASDRQRRIYGIGIGVGAGVTAPTTLDL